MKIGRLPHLGIWLVACISFRLIAAGAWKRLEDDADDIPPPRYSHGAVIVRFGQYAGMLITHGYNKQGAANWLSDTWFRNVHPISGPWQKVAISGPKPSARLGHSLVPLGGSRSFMFGGDDGGPSSRGGSYFWGSYFSEQWFLQLSGSQSAGYVGKWRAHPTSSVVTPSRRSLHTMVSSPVGDSILLVLFGGLQPTADRNKILRKQGTFSGIMDTSELWIGVVDDTAESVVWDAVCPIVSSPSSDFSAGNTSPIGVLGDQAVPACPETVQTAGESRQQNVQSASTHHVWPAPRHGHASAIQVVNSQQRAVWVFGGASLDCHSSVHPVKSGIVDVLRHSTKSCALSDLWFVTVDTNSDGTPSARVVGGWQRPTPSLGADPSVRLRGSLTWPMPRSHPAAVWRHNCRRDNNDDDGADSQEQDGCLVMVAGATCGPGCVCRSDVWVAEPYGVSDATTVHWSLVSGVSEASSGVGGEATLVVTAAEATQTQRQACGGDSCPPPRYRHSFVSDSFEEQRSYADSRCGCDTTNNASCSQCQWRGWLYGGEVYHPSVYYADTWQLSFDAVWSFNAASRAFGGLVFPIAVVVGLLLGIASLAYAGWKRRSLGQKRGTGRSRKLSRRRMQDAGSVIPWKRRDPID